MTSLLHKTVFVALVVAVYGQDDQDKCYSSDFCRDSNSCRLDYMHYEVTEIITTIENALGLAGTCDPIQASQLEYWLYTRNNNVTPIIVNGANPIQLDTTKKLVILIPGWFSTGNSAGFPELIAAYLQRYDANVLVLNWYNITLKAYKVVVCEIPLVAKVVAARLCSLNVPFNKIHIIGHSFGAQLAGWIGQQTQRICGRAVDRVTGLDPAGPVYQELPPRQRLSSGDATFVDTIHTNEGIANYYGNCGDADFHPNCGTHQPGCPEVTLNSLTNAAINLGVAKGAAACNGSDFNQAFQQYGNIALCSHFRSIFLMAESVNSENFVAKSCRRCPCQCKSDDLFATYAIMGENCSKNSKGGYWLPTNSNSPFAKGCPTNKVIC